MPLEMNAAAEPQFQKADPAARRRALIILAAIAILGLILVPLLDRLGEGLQEWMHDDPERAAPEVANLLRLLAVLMATPLVVLSLWLAWYAARVYSHGRFPPPGVAVLRDTRILEDAPARRRAVVGFILAALMLAFAVAASAALWRVARVVSSWGEAPELQAKLLEKSAVGMASGSGAHTRARQLHVGRVRAVRPRIGVFP